MKRRAFTLVELLVVIAIIGLLSTVAVVALGSAGMNSRNTKRKADLLQISKALELYYADNSSYPTTDGGWYCVTGAWGYSGNTDESGSDAWIPDLAPAYMARLPRDPNTNKTNPSSDLSTCRTSAAANTYVYRSNGTDYKLLAICTPEGAISSSDSFYDPVRYYYAFQVSTPGAAAW